MMSLNIRFLCPSLRVRHSAQSASAASLLQLLLCSLTGILISNQILVFSFGACFLKNLNQHICHTHFKLKTALCSCLKSHLQCRSHLSRLLKSYPFCGPSTNHTSSMKSSLPTGVYMDHGPILVLPDPHIFAGGSLKNVDMCLTPLTFEGKE